MASPFTKSDLKDMAYYFDDERIAVVKKNKTTGEFIVYYIKYRLAEDENDLRLAGYYWKKFQIKIKQHPYRKSGVRGIKPYAI